MQKNVSGTVLLVEDDPMTRNIFSLILTRTGLDIIEAVDGVDALEKVAIHNPDVVMLDVTMPKMDGFQVCETLRSQPETADLPVVFVTTHMDEKSIARGASFGNTRYLVKPIAFRDLLAVLTDLVVQQQVATPLCPSVN